mgnify:FL=1
MHQNRAHLLSAEWAMSNNEQGFSLIGCITTLILLGVLTTIALSVTSAFRLRAEQSTLAQSDLINASNCIEQIKSVSESHEFKSIYDSKNLKCSNATIKITPLKTTLTANNNSSNSITAKIEPISDLKTTDTSYYLCTVTSGTVELNYVASGNTNQ